jgi:hypothetical protein
VTVLCFATGPSLLFGSASCASGCRALLHVAVNQTRQALYACRCPRQASFREWRRGLNSDPITGLLSISVLLKKQIGKRREEPPRAAITKIMYGIAINASAMPSTSVRCAAAIFPESEIDRTRHGHRENGTLMIPNRHFESAGPRFRRQLVLPLQAHRAARVVLARWAGIRVRLELPAIPRAR